MTDVHNMGMVVKDYVTVDLDEWMGNDQSICRAARVSLVGVDTIEKPESAGLINYLMANRHGSPFEHTTLKFRIKAPIMVFREFHRHRAGWSYNEISGRYSTLKPTFYLPGDDRPMINAGTSARPEMVLADPIVVNDAQGALLEAYRVAWDSYVQLLDLGVANEVARLCLPVGLFSEMYATCNVRSLMHFLSLRTDDPRAAVRSRPQLEISLVARAMEHHLEQLFPLTYAAFNQNGRVAP